MLFAYLTYVAYYPFRVLSQFAFHLSPLHEVGDSVRQSNRSGGPLVVSDIRSVFRAAKLPLRLLSRLGFGGLRPLHQQKGPVYQEEDFGAFRYDFESTGDMLVKYHLFSWEL